MFQQSLLMTSVRWRVTFCKVFLEHLICPVSKKKCILKSILTCIFLYKLLIWKTLVKVSKSRKQFMVKWILQKNEHWTSALEDYYFKVSTKESLYSWKNRLDQNTNEKFDRFCPLKIATSRLVQKRVYVLAKRT